jgi:hypothetical protein
MLTSVTADLPVYLVPPATRESGRSAGDDKRAMRAADKVELRDEAAERANSQEPESSIYGPDGRFVAATARAESEQDTVPDRGRQKQRTDEESARELSLAEFDAVVPPAAREELRALADRVHERAKAETLESKDYLLISDLMTRVGRYTEALEAQQRAEELEQSDESADSTSNAVNA